MDGAGGGVDEVVKESRGRILGEVTLLWLLTLLAISGVVALVRFGGAPELLLIAVPVLFMYAPVWSCQLRGADPWDYPMALPDLPWKAPGAWGRAFAWGLGFSAVIAVPFVLGYHVWQIHLVPEVEELLHVRLYAGTPSFRWVWPSELPLWLPYHLFFVAIPEEMFYRGYLQTRLDEVWPPRWRLLGTMVGPGLLVTCVVFAFGHSIVWYQWWHVFIIVPSLAFGWLRARTGGILAGAVFHAWCNVTVAVLDTLYGIVPP